MGEVGDAASARAMSSTLSSSSSFSFVSHGIGLNNGTTTGSALGDEAGLRATGGRRVGNIGEDKLAEPAGTAMDETSSNVTADVEASGSKESSSVKADRSDVTLKQRSRARKYLGKDV